MSIIAIGAYGAYKFIKHEKLQDEKLADLQIQVAWYREESSASRPDVPEFAEDGYNYLAIGNSITKHPICDYWWNEIGMAASSEQNDYVHLVAEGIGIDANVYAFNFYIWEVQSSDRAETLTVLEPYLSQNLNLVTVQLGENVVDRATLEQDYEELIRYIQDRCPQCAGYACRRIWGRHGDRRHEEGCGITLQHRFCRHFSYMGTCRISGWIGSDCLRCRWQGTYRRA